MHGDPSQNEQHLSRWASCGGVEPQPNGMWVTVLYKQEKGVHHSGIFLHIWRYVTDINIQRRSAQVTSSGGTSDAVHSCFLIVFFLYISKKHCVFCSSLKTCFVCIVFGLSDGVMTFSMEWSCWLLYLEGVNRTICILLFRVDLTNPWFVEIFARCFLFVFGSKLHTPSMLRV